MLTVILLSILGFALVRALMCVPTMVGYMLAKHTQNGGEFPITLAITLVGAAIMGALCILGLGAGMLVSM